LGIRRGFQGSGYFLLDMGGGDYAHACVSYDVESSFVDVVTLEGETPVKTVSEIVEGFELPTWFSSVGLFEGLGFWMVESAMRSRSCFALCSLPLRIFILPP